MGGGRRRHREGAPTRPRRQVGQAERREHQEDTPGAPDQASHERPRRHRWQDPGHEPVRRR